MVCYLTRMFFKCKCQIKGACQVIRLVSFFNIKLGGIVRWPTRVNAIKKWFAANKIDRMQTKKQNLSRCKQKDRMQTKKDLQTKRKWNNVERPRANTSLAIFPVNEAN